MSSLNVSIYTRATNGTFRETPRCLMVGTVGTAASSLAYYRTECGYTDAFATTQHVCGMCGGAGTVAKKRPLFARKPCPTCKGVEEPEVYVSLEDLKLLQTTASQVTTP